MSREPVRLVSALFAAWLVILGGQAFTDLLPHKVTALLVLATAAAKVAAGEYTRSRVTPVDQD